MKFTILSGDDHKATRQRTQEVSAFFEYIKEDHNQWLISMFRNDLPRLEHPEYYIRYRKIAHVLPAVELRKQENGALVMQAYNGLVVLEVSPLRGDEALRSAKELAASWPTTLAAFVGADGQTLVVLVRVALRDGSLPATEGEAEAFYEAAFQQVLPIYTQVLQDYPIVAQSGGLRHEVLMPLDAAPYMDLHAACIKVTPQPSAAQEADAYDDLPAPRHRQKDEDWDAHAIYERIYGEAARRAHATTGISPRDPLNPTLLTALAHEMCEQQVPQEEAFTHIWQHVMFRDGAQEDVVRSIVDATYDDESPDQHPVLGTPRREGDELRELIRRLEQRYAFRHNNIMGCTEFRRNVSGPAPWTPVDRSIVSDLTIEMRLADIHVSEKDVWQYVMGRRRIPQYNPVGEFLYECRGKWDGKDHIRALARTVPTDTPQWADWFHTWFLAMVAQWTGRNLRFGNSLVPLLISRQGFHKSDFCRQLLPRDLRSWGFTDSLNVGEEKTVMLAMGQTLLINLDEFNSISPRKQEGFLKNIIQLPMVKLKRPYARVIEDVPRLASFIATTNQSDVLSDPAGSRRFIAVRVTEDIDTRQQPNYEQLYAQAMEELDNHVRYWLDGEETTQLMEHNRQFQQQSSALTFFWDYYTIPASEEEEGAIWMSSSALLAEVKRRAGASLQPPSVNKFSRELRNIPGIQIHRGHGSDQYLVRPI
ncbi:MAG: DUF3874 domain-containing protein [Bacteroidaceae bacterium]|nr:DUF3874 domain-containing protein [Bacteroidaceae bacterium]